MNAQCGNICINMRICLNNTHTVRIFIAESRERMYEGALGVLEQEGSCIKY